MKTLKLFCVMAILAAGESEAQPLNKTLEQIQSYASSATVPTLSTQQLLFAGAPENEALKKLLLEPPKNPSQLSGKRIAIVATDGVEEIELTGAKKALTARGAQVDLVSPKAPTYPAKFGVQMPEIRQTHILAVHYFENAGWLKIDRFLDAVNASEYDAVIIPGGTWNPDALRGDAAALAFIKAVNAQGKPVAAICHGPQVLQSAGLLKGKRATMWWSCQSDITSVGGTAQDEPVVVDGNIITSRAPIDLPQFVEAIAQAVSAKKVGVK